MSTRVTEVPAADSAEAEKHFRSALRFETDCWDVHETAKHDVADFVLLDVRSPDAYRKGHVESAINLPHAKISQETLDAFPSDTTFVVYCAGPHCNGAHRAAIKLAQLRRPVKIMIGGIAGWLDEGFQLISTW